MKKLISIILCICLMVIPINVTALDLPDTNTTEITDETIVNGESIETEIIGDSTVTISPNDNSPEAQAIEKIIASRGKEVASLYAYTDNVVSGGIYYIKNYYSGKYMNVHYGVDANGTNVYQWTSDSSIEQKFKVVYDSSTASYKIYAMCSSNGTNRVLDVVRNGAALASGQNVDIWTPVDHTAQRLRLTYLIDGLYHIHMLGNKDLYFTTKDSSNGTSGGTAATSAGNVYLSTFDVDLNQQWQFIPTTVGGQDALPTSPSNALAITGATPYHASIYMLTAGSAGYIKLTATQNYNFSAFTTGSTDTYIEVYSDVACTNLITYDDDDGHSYNAMVYFNITSGTTYYIKVRGWNSTTSGAYTFVLHRGMPTSQSEKSDMFTTYNSSTYQSNTNCYTYALGYYVNPVTGATFRWNGQNPGEMSGNEITGADLVNAETAKEAIEAALTADCEYFGGDWAEISASTQPRTGYYKVALVLAPGSDYHWYRQLPNGQWAHKPSVEEASNTDFSNNIIYDPSTCNRNGLAYDIPNYTEFIGWYEIKTPTTTTISTASIASATEAYPYYPVTSPVYTNIAMDTIKTLYIGMPYEDSIEVLGAPHSYYGSGRIGHVYKLADETEIIIYYKSGTIEQIRTMPVNGTYEVIVG